MKAKPDLLFWKKRIVFCGVDEVGRGALAGPVVAAAVILPPFTNFKGLKDSKQLTAEEREDFFQRIKNRALAIGIGFASHQEIDRYNIRNASFLAMKRAIKKLNYQCDLALVDGFTIPDCKIKTNGLIKGDEQSISIACASIIAKVYRDRLMQRLHKKYPEYNFLQNKGYPTLEHKKVINQIGPSPIHRRSFQPVRQILFNFNG
ncbi:MAG: ribonuclease HII [candidate division WOR-3 bacterium]|nr:ribonuclease HII [candidate division WOR-3 bacterium]